MPQVCSPGSNFQLHERAALGELSPCCLVTIPRPGFQSSPTAWDAGREDRNQGHRG